jgi:hypothetical protein
MMCSQSCLTAYNWLRRHLDEMVDCRFVFFLAEGRQLKRPACLGRIGRVA